jgi:hypothetical protein
MCGCGRGECMLVSLVSLVSATSGEVNIDRVLQIELGLTPRKRGCKVARPPIRTAS